MKYEVVDHGPWLEAYGAHSGYRVRMSAHQRALPSGWTVQVFVRGSESEGEVAVSAPDRLLGSAIEAFDFGYQCATLWIDAQNHRMARELRCHHFK